MPIALNLTGVQFPDGTTQTSAGIASTTNIQTFTTTGTWQAPAGLSSVYVTLIGGGGNGGNGGAAWTNAGTNYAGSGGGGGSGAVLVGYRLSVVPLTTYTITVGAATQASSIGALISLNPGTSGSSASGSTAGQPGQGGSGFTLPTGVYAVFTGSGNPGGSGFQAPAYVASGGTGGSVPYFNYTGGTGGGNSVGGAGQGYGSGGGGGAANSYAGGAGKPGLVILQW